MKKIILLFVLMAAILGAQDVDVEELRSVDREITFTNYVGPHDRIDTAAEIRGVGFALASALERGTRGRVLLKYSIIRAVDPAEPGRFDADILSIDKEARVDHIDNVRRILSGYLQGSFGYSTEDARLLARFITIYNAVYRSQMDYFSQKYKRVVLANLSARDAGLSTRYFEWPGATKVLIPLTGEEEGLSALSTSELTEEKVIDEMREQEDMGLEDRKEMVELKEREVEDKKEDLEQVKEDLEDKKAELEEDRKTAVTEKEKQAVEEKEAEVREQEKQVVEKQREIERKEDEIDRERTGIVTDERSKDSQVETTRAAAEAEPAVFSEDLYFLELKTRHSVGTSSSLSIIDPVKGSFSETSKVGNIARRSVYFYKNRILVVSRTSAGNTRGVLVLVNAQDLEEFIRGSDVVYSETVIRIQGSRIYAVIESEGAFRVGRFDENLKLAAGSAEVVNPDSTVSLYGDKLFVQAKNNRLLVLYADDLTKVED